MEISFVTLNKFYFKFYKTLQNVFLLVLQLKKALLFAKFILGKSYIFYYLLIKAFISNFNIINYISFSYFLYFVIYISLRALHYTSVKYICNWVNCSENNE